jgi:pimeloyl-ACP methyl ester carboxylesterase
VPEAPPAAPATAALLLPGMSLNATLFPSFAFPTIAPEFNRTAPPPERGMEPYLERLDELAAHPAWAGTERRLVVGHSFGGMLALAWLLRHGCAGPARADGLVLIGTTAGPMFDAVRVRLAGAGRHEWRIGIGPLLPLWNSAAVTRGFKRLLSGGSLRTADVDFRRLGLRGDLGLAGWRNTDWDARRAYRAAMDGFDVRRRLHQIRLPTIVLHGTRDRLFPLSAARVLAAGLPRAELRIVEGAGHVLPLTHGDAVLTAVRDLLPHP